jgi:L-malate glycosyltransferase
MKVLHIIDSLGLGGAQTVVKGILESLDNAYLFSLREREHCIAIRSDRVRIFPSRKRYSLAPLKALKEIIETEDIGVLHCHLFRSQVFGYMLKRQLPHVRLIFHEHGQVFGNNQTGPMSNIEQAVFLRFLRASNKRVDLYIAVSQQTRRLLVKQGIPESRIKVRYNFVDLDRFSQKNISWDIASEREKQGIANDDFLVGYAGRLVENKGYRDFMSSKEHVKDKRIRFIIAGDGPGRNEIKSGIKYLGYVSEMAWFYSLLDCLVVPSHWEPMGLTEIEAQAMGVPVIVSDVPALNEIIDGRNGLLFKAKDPVDLAKKIMELSHDTRLRKSLIAIALETVQEYSLKAYKSDIASITEAL